MGLFRKKEPKFNYFYAGSRYKTVIYVQYFGTLKCKSFEIFSHHIKDGFLICITPNDGVKAIATSLIAGYEVVQEEIKDEKTGADS